MLTEARLKELLSYDSETGNFTWRVTRGRSAMAGQLAGYVMANGYRDIIIDRQHHKAHRLAWLYVYGVWPTNLIDHKDRDKLNNKINNLRDATNSQNQACRLVQKNSTLGVKGVSHRGNRYRASIRISGKQTFLGSFTTISAASAAYQAAAIVAFGEFARAE